MQAQDGFILFNDISEFADWLNGQPVTRTIRHVQNHHTFVPNYDTFESTGHDHFELQRRMEHHHVVTNGWSAIGQQFTTFPDGKIMTGRDLNQTPATILGHNHGGIGIEHVGDFDAGKDQMTAEQRDAIIQMNAVLAKRFRLAVNTENFVYHHWFRTITCPGTAFFGGNTREAAHKNLLPEITSAINEQLSSFIAEKAPEPPAIEVAINDFAAAAKEKSEVAFAALAFWKPVSKDAFSKQVSVTDKLIVIAIGMLLLTIILFLVVKLRSKFKIH